MSRSTFSVLRQLGLCVALLTLPFAAGSAAPAGQYAVTLSQMRFGAVPTGLHVGDVITFVNKDTVPHTVTARDRSFNLQIAPGKSASLRLSKAGTFSFYCVLHPAMRGTLKVS